MHFFGKLFIYFIPQIILLPCFNRLRFILLLGSLHVAITGFPQETALAKVSKLVLELEYNTQWVGVTEVWKTARSGWVAGMQKTPAPVAQGLLQFESNLVPTGMETARAGRKANWRKAFK